MKRSQIELERLDELFEKPYKGKGWQPDDANKKSCEEFITGPDGKSHQVITASASLMQKRKLVSSLVEELSAGTITEEDVDIIQEIMSVVGQNGNWLSALSQEERDLGVPKEERTSTLLNSLRWMDIASPWDSDQPEVDIREDRPLKFNRHRKEVKLMSVMFPVEGVVEDQYVDWSLKHPCRLTGDDLSPDILSGHDRRENHDSPVDDGKSNWIHINSMKREQEENFIKMSNIILRHRKHPKMLKAKHREYTDRMMEIFYAPEVKVMPGERTLTLTKIYYLHKVKKYPMTFEQSSAITHLFKLCGIDSHPNARIGNWFKTAYKVINPDEIRELDKDTDESKADMLDHAIFGEIWDSSMSTDDGDWD